jgi:hypothetical protein
VCDAIIAGRIAMQQMAELAEIEVLRQHIPTTEMMTVRCRVLPSRSR